MLPYQPIAVKSVQQIIEKFYDISWLKAPLNLIVCVLVLMIQLKLDIIFSLGNI